MNKSDLFQFLKYKQLVIEKIISNLFSYMSINQGTFTVQVI